MKNRCIFALVIMKQTLLQTRAISSAGSEHLVYTEGVGGSNPSSPTTFKTLQMKCFFLF